MRTARKPPRSSSKRAKGAPAVRNRQTSLRDVYLKSCVENGIHPNSGVQSMLPDKAGVPYPLDTLNANQNYLGDKGILPLLAAIDKMAGLRMLYLAENGLRNKGIQALVSSAMKHPSLEFIDISDNYISEGAAVSLEKLLRGNRRIVDLAIENTKIDVEWRVKLRDLLEANRQDREATAALEEPQPEGSPRAVDAQPGSSRRIH